MLPEIYSELLLLFYMFLKCSHCIHNIFCCRFLSSLETQKNKQGSLSLLYKCGSFWFPHEKKAHREYQQFADISKKPKIEKTEKFVGKFSRKRILAAPFLCPFSGEGHEIHVQKLCVCSVGDAGFLNINS